MTSASTPTDAPRHRVIVTRPAREAAIWVDRLLRAGFEAEALPLIEIAPVADTASVAAARQRLAQSFYDAAMFVSGNAVEFLVGDAALDVSGLPDLRWLAPGPGTVSALRAAGVPPGQIDAPAADALQFDSEALWDVVGVRDWRGRRVLVVRGQGADESAGGPLPQGQGRDWIARQWQAAGAEVDFISVYQRRAPQWTPAETGRALAAAADGSVWVFSSSEAVAHLAQAMGGGTGAGPGWHQARAVATHPRIAATLQAAGWGEVFPSRPALGDLVALLHSIE